MRCKANLLAALRQFSSRVAGSYARRRSVNKMVWFLVLQLPSILECPMVWELFTIGPPFLYCIWMQHSSYRCQVLITLKLMPAKIQTIQDVSQVNGARYKNKFLYRESEGLKTCQALISLGSWICVKRQWAPQILTQQSALHFTPRNTSWAINPVRAKYDFSSSSAWAIILLPWEVLIVVGTKPRVSTITILFNLSYACISEPKYSRHLDVWH